MRPPVGFIPLLPFALSLPTLQQRAVQSADSTIIKTFSDDDPSKSLGTLSVPSPLSFLNPAAPPGSPGRPATSISPQEQARQFTEFAVKNGLLSQQDSALLAPTLPSGVAAASASSSTASAVAPGASALSAQAAPGAPAGVPSFLTSFPGLSLASIPGVNQGLFQIPAQAGSPFLQAAGATAPALGAAAAAPAAAAQAAPQFGQAGAQAVSQFAQAPAQFAQAPAQFAQAPTQFAQAQFAQAPAQFAQAQAQQFAQAPAGQIAQFGQAAANQLAQGPAQFAQVPSQFAQAPSQFAQLAAQGVAQQAGPAGVQGVPQQPLGIPILVLTQQGGQAASNPAVAQQMMAPVSAEVPLTLDQLRAKAVGEVVSTMKAPVPGLLDLPDLPTLDDIKTGKVKSVTLMPKVSPVPAMGSSVMALSGSNAEAALVAGTGPSYTSAEERQFESNAVAAASTDSNDGTPFKLTTESLFKAFPQVFKKQPETVQEGLQTLSALGGKSISSLVNQMVAEDSKNGGGIGSLSVQSDSDSADSPSSTRTASTLSSKETASTSTVSGFATTTTSSVSAKSTTTVTTRSRKTTTTTITATATGKIGALSTPTETPELTFPLDDSDRPTTKKNDEPSSSSRLPAIPAATVLPGQPAPYQQAFSPYFSSFGAGAPPVPYAPQPPSFNSQFTPFPPSYPPGYPGAYPYGFAGPAGQPFIDPRFGPRGARTRTRRRRAISGQVLPGVGEPNPFPFHNGAKRAVEDRSASKGAMVKTIVSYPDETPGWVVEKGRDAIEAAGGKVTHTFRKRKPGRNRETDMAKMFSANMPAGMFDKKKTAERTVLGTGKFPATVNEDGIIRAIDQDKGKKGAKRE